MSLPLISVIVPVYGVEQFLDTCVRSIVEQTYRNLEIILVDDGSPDRCPEMCDAWKARDSRIRVVHKQNGGLSSARNAGLDVAQGDYIGFVDSDDYIHERMYELLWDALRSAGKGMACCLSSRVSGDGKQPTVTDTPKKTILGVQETLNAIFYGEAGTSVWRKLYAKPVFDGIRFPEGENNEDYPLIVPTALAAGGMVFVAQSLYCYRVREGSITNVGYLTEGKSDLVNRHLQHMNEQLQAAALPVEKSYGFFAAKNAYYIAITMEKNRDRLSPKVQESLARYRKTMGRYLLHYVGSKHSPLKEKLLFLLVLTGLLSPLYRLLNRK